MNNPSSDPLLIHSHDPNHYQILETLHSSKSTTIYQARHVNSDTLLRIKVFHNFMDLEDLHNLYDLIFLSKRCINHSNIIGVYCTFKHRDELWVVMPFFNMESLSSIVNSSFPCGLSEDDTAFVLKETLKAILHVHEHGDVHEKIDFDHVFVNKGKDIGDVKLDIGLLSYNTEKSNYGQRPIWMVEPDLRRSEKVDIWMFGLLAMELYFGKIPAENPVELMTLVSRIKDLKTKNSRFFVKLVGGCFPSDCSSDSGGNMPSRLLGEVMALCLDPNPLNRPTASELLKHKFFTKPHNETQLLKWLTGKFK